MATFKHTGGVSKFGEKLITGMVANGYTQEVPKRRFRSLRVSAATAFPNPMQHHSPWSPTPRPG
jgi:error-prone DNA polymerase